MGRWRAEESMGGDALSEDVATLSSFALGKTSQADQLSFFASC